MIILASAIFFFFVTYQKRLLKKELELNRIKTEQQEEIIRNTISAQEKERKRIARDLHDEVGAMLSVVKLNVSRIERKTDAGFSKELAGETKSYLDDVIAQVRRISRDLLPPSLEKLGLVYAVEEQCKMINKSEQIKVHFWKNSTFFRFEIEKELALYRIIQEVINNALKHSGATIINVNFRFTKTNLLTSVSDNGKGFEVNTKLSSGLGLRNLESRTQVINAHYKLKSQPGKGTTALIYL
jgi:signal transduction histidine kinase